MPRNFLRQPFSSHDLAKWLELEIIGPELEITHIASLDKLKFGCLAFAKNLNYLKYTPPAGVTLLAPKILENCSDISCILTNDPRLSYARTLQFLEKNVGFCDPDEPANIDPTAKISPTAHIGNGVVIGARTIVGHNVFIGDGAKIGCDCRIKAGAVIGDKGFGFAYDENHIPIEIIHLGNTIIHDRVEVGALTTVCQGTLSDTILEDDVKLDDHVHIAHNVHLHRRVTVTANATLSGRANIEEDVYIGPGATISNGVAVRQNAKISLGAVVVKDVDKGETVTGNFAINHRRFLRQNSKAKK